jgi:hypothetical protein
MWCSSHAAGSAVLAALAESSVYGIDVHDVGPGANGSLFFCEKHHWCGIERLVRIGAALSSSDWCKWLYIAASHFRTHSLMHMHNRHATESAAASYQFTHQETWACKCSASQPDDLLATRQAAGSMVPVLGSSSKQAVLAMLHSSSCETACESFR